MNVGNEYTQTLPRNKNSILMLIFFFQLYVLGWGIYKPCGMVEGGGVEIF